MAGARLDFRPNSSGGRRPAIAALLIFFLFFLWFLIPVLAPSMVLAQPSEENTAIAEASRLERRAALQRARGQYAEAELLFRQALAIWEKALGPEYPIVARKLINLVSLHYAQGRYAEAELLLRRALAIYEKTGGPDHPAVGNALNNLAELIHAQGRYAEAEPLYRRALAIQEKARGPEHPTIGTILYNLARLHHAQGRYAEAESLFSRALAIRQKTLGPEHPDVAATLDTLANFYAAQGRYAEAERLSGKALAIWEKALGPEHPGVAVSLNTLAELYEAQGRYAEAERLLRRALAIWEKLGPEDPRVVWSLYRLASMLAERQDVSTARSLYERARQIQFTQQRLNVEFDEGTRWGTGGFRPYIKLLAAIARNPQPDSNSGQAVLDAFVAAEHARGGMAQTALASASARAAAEDSATADLARQVQDLRNRRRAVINQLTAEYGTPSGQRQTDRFESLQKEAQLLDRSLLAAIDRLHGAFPKYAELATPAPIDLAAVQRLLRPDEALVAYFTLDDRLLVWLVRPGQAPFYRDIPIEEANLIKMVAQVRASADQSHNPDLVAGRLVAFDVAGSHALYALLVKPLRSQLAGVNHLIVVPDDVLLPLPFSVLVTQAEGQAYRRLSDLHSQTLSSVSQELTDYAKLEWLAKEYAISVLPSATSLRALRQLARARGAEVEPFIGIGDPILRGAGRERGGTMMASRGAGVVIDELWKMNRLPGARDELMTVAKVLGADPQTSLYLGARATKPTVLNLNASGRLGKPKVLAFATHGLIAGQVTGLTQPALVLTPPVTATEQDDGLLSLEDILRLKLSSTDWVILSACNTAAADGSGEGLSGLVRAFFFAGAPSLLVSHWSVDDKATQALMTEVFRRYAGDSQVARAEALRQGMLTLMARAKDQTAYFVHPFAWASFFLVGEGSGGRN